MSGLRRMNGATLVLALLFAAGALVTGAATVLGLLRPPPDALVAVLFAVTASSAIDLFVRGRMVGPSAPAHRIALIVIGLAGGIAFAAVGSVGAVLVFGVAVIGVALLLLDRRRRPA